jgi:hypothetical protein
LSTADKTTWIGVKHVARFFHQLQYFYRKNFDSRRKMALYHTAEHLRITDRKNGTVNGAAKAWQEKRNVLGYFDGRPIKILPPDPKGQGVAMPDYYSYGGFNFLASPRGELYVSSGLDMITFDIAFDSGSFEDGEEANRYLGDKTPIRTTVELVGAAIRQFDRVSVS